MKVRQGFISNSSSSSFMLHGGNIEEIATHMLRVVIEAYSEIEDEELLTIRKREYRKWRANLKIALKRKDVKDGGIGITMPSCNYNTYLVIDGDYLYITTCNNHSWGFNGINYEYREDYAIIRDMVKSKFYFNIRNKLIHSHENYENNDEHIKCPKCAEYYGSYVVDQKDNRICGECFEGKLELTEKRKEELHIEKLKKNIKDNGVGNPIISLDLED